MARERMVTRTIQFTEIEVMSCDTVNKKVETFTLQLSGDLTGVKQSKVMEMCNSQLPGGYVSVALGMSTIKEELYGMPESEFIRLAQVLPPRGSQE